MATSYVVLEYLAVDPGETSKDWREIGRADALTPTAAIKAVTLDLASEERNGTFVAVPARNWRPITRRVQQVEKELWS